MTLPPLPEPYGTGAYPYPDTYTESQMLAYQKATVEACAQVCEGVDQAASSNAPMLLSRLIRSLLK
jgi:hypothetical protein